MERRTLKNLPRVMAAVHLLSVTLAVVVVDRWMW
jgi:hypothetical protein